MLTAAQCRAARAALNWTVRDLGRIAGINFNTVVRLEKGSDMKSSVVLRIEQAFRQAGVIVGDDGNLWHPDFVVKIPERQKAAA